jgi:uncharacterized protein (DUF58 family)
LRVTPLGRVYLVLTLGVGLGALNTGNNLLYLVLGLQLSTILVSGFLSEWCLAHLRVARLPVEGGFAGEPLPLRYRLDAPKGWPAFALQVSEAGFDMSQPGQLPFLPGGGTVGLRASLAAARRGPLSFTGITVTTLFPLGLFAKSRTFDQAATAWVYPARRSTAFRTPPQSHTSGENMAVPRAGGGGDLLGLREVGPLEDARRIHWLKSAALGRPLQAEREREQERTVELTVHPAATPQALDAPCEREAAFALRCLAAGVHVGLTTPDARLPAAGGPAQAQRILELLARAGYGEAGR